MPDASPKAGIPAHEKESVELCPICDARMTPVNYDYASGIIIDHCPNNHGAWLDAHELQKIQIYRSAAQHSLQNRKEELLDKIKTDAMNIQNKIDSANNSFFEKIFSALFSA